MAESSKKGLKLWVVDDRRHRRGPVAATKTPSDEESVGVFLRTMRERRHESLEQVARTLRINHRYLKGIEEGRFEDLPGKTYAVGFVRSYAEYLRVDVDSVLRHLRRELGAVHEQRELIFPEPLSEGGVPGAALIATSVFVAIVVYGVWYYQSVTTQPPYDLAAPEPAVSSSSPSRVAGVEPFEAGGRPQPASPNPLVPLVPPGARPVPDASMAIAGEPLPRPPVPAPRTPSVGGDSTGSVTAAAPPASAERNGPATASTPSVSAPPAPPSAAAPAAPSNVEPPLPPEPPALAARPAPPTAENTQVADLPPHLRVSRSGAAPALAAEVPTAGGRFGEGAASTGGRASSENQVASLPGATVDRRIVLRAAQASWIEIRSRETGRIVVGRLLRSGESYEVPREAGLMLTTGNAGGLEVVVDGDVAPPLGPEGVILRNVTLDGDRLLAGTADR